MTGSLGSFETARQAGREAVQGDVQTKIASLTRANLSPEAKEKKLREACEGFESIFIQKMWQEMRKSVHQSSLLHSREEQFWQDMYDQELAKKMTSAGGIGLADMMYEQLSSHLTSASKETALLAQRERAFIPPQAPLLGDKIETKSIDLSEPVTGLYEELSPGADEEQSDSAKQQKSGVNQEALQGDPRNGTQPTANARVVNAPKRQMVAERSGTFAQAAGQSAASAQPFVPIQPSSPVQPSPSLQPPTRQPVAEKEEKSPWLMPQSELLVQPAQSEEPVDPHIENALASMRASVEQNKMHQNGAGLAHVAYAQPSRRQQPVASGLEMAQVARRQAGDQLGSRGVREPLLPQTQRARNSTMTAYAKQELHGEQLSSLQQSQQIPADAAQPMQPLPYSFPRNQAEMQQQDVPFAPMMHSSMTSASTQPGAADSLQQRDQNQPQASLLSNSPFEPMKESLEKKKSQRRVHRSGLAERKNRRQQEATGIKTLNLDRTQTVPRTQNPAPAFTMAQAQTAPSVNQSVLRAVPSAGQSQESQTSYAPIPPLTAADLSASR